MFTPVDLPNPIARDIVEGTLRSLYDHTPVTFLLKDFRDEGASHCPLLVICLHGSKSHQDQGMTHTIYQNAFGHWAEVFNANRAIYICPEYRGNSWMSAAAESDLVEIIQWAEQRYEPERILLMGGSMGGTSALIFAARWAELLDGVIALCPATDVREMYPAFSEQLCAAYGGTPTQLPEEYLSRSTRCSPGKLPALPIAIVHGSDDLVIPVHHSRELVALLQREANTHIFYHEVEGGDHDAPIQYPLESLLRFVTGKADDFQSL